jgi:hypothetical protein
MSNHARISDAAKKKNLPLSVKIVVENVDQSRNSDGSANNGPVHLHVEKTRDARVHGHHSTHSTHIHIGGITLVGGDELD